MSTVRRTFAAVHGAAAFLPLFLLAFVGSRLWTDSCNHVGASPLLAAVALFLLLVVAGTVRSALLGRIDAVAATGWLTGGLVLGVLYPIDRCNLLIGYAQFTDRHLPLASMSCCRHLPQLPVCVAARDELAAFADAEVGKHPNAAAMDAKQRNAELQREKAEREQREKAEREQREKAEREQREKAEREQREKAEARRREDAQRAWRAAMSRRLLSLRDTGAHFEELGPLAEDERQRDAGPRLINPCGESAKQIVPLRTPAGWFVPVASQEYSACSHAIWFVPRADTPNPSTPVRSDHIYHEYDLEFTVRLVAADLDGDSTVEAVVVQHWEHPEGVDEGQSTWIVEPTGERRETPFDDVRDVDGDGRMDALLELSDTMNAAGCDENEVWVPASLSAPSILLHGVDGGRFSLSDAQARAHRAKFCEGVVPLASAVRGGAVDESELARRMVCQLANGSPSAAVTAEVDKICRRDYSIPEDCKSRRPGVCQFASRLKSLPGLFEKLSPYLASR